VAVAEAGLWPDFVCQGVVVHTRCAAAGRDECGAGEIAAFIKSGVRGHSFAVAPSLRLTIYASWKTLLCECARFRKCVLPVVAL
jgi:hypothetical protein